MRLQTLFRFSVYLSLTISTACLGLAESTQIEGLSIFYLALSLILLAEYLTADRWLITQSVANLVAIVILISWLLWFLLGIDAGSDDQLGELLPRAGPLLGVLLVAKLLRPKETSDYWMLHLLGLVQVMLASVLALQSRLDRENPLFPLLLLSYALSLIWAMVLFHLYREHEAANGRSVPGQAKVSTGNTGLEGPAPWRTLGAASSLAWFVLAFVAGLTVFFAIPRPGQETAASLLIPGAVRPQTGFSPGLDLNETSPIEVSDEEVMRIEAVDAGGERVILDCDAQRWRGVACSMYVRGRWVPARSNDIQVLPMRVPEPSVNQLKLSFNVDLSKLQSGWYLNEDERLPDLLDRRGSQPVFLADPVSVTAPTTRPTGSLLLPRVALQGENPLTQLTYRFREMTLSASETRRSRRLMYDQLYEPPDETRQQWSPAATFQLQQPPQRAYWDTLHALPVAPEDRQALIAKAQEFLNRAGVDAAPLRDGTITGAKKRQLRVALAKALERQLANSPEEYGYTLDRPRQNMALDPTVDFVCNTKEGHCGLYASALSLMLRTQGIPARVVIGFRGARWYSAGEYHSVCQYHAHAWVEAFIEEATNKPIPELPQPNTATDERNTPEMVLTAGQWLTLDPTPAGGTAAFAGVGSPSFIEDQIHFLRYLWEFFILEYQGDLQRDRLLGKINSTFNVDDIKSFWETVLHLVERTGFPWLVLAALVAGGLILAGAIFLWRWRRGVQRARVTSSVPFYARFLRLMERLRLRPRPAQTPAEFADAAGQALQASSGMAVGAHLPPRIASAFYQVRFGGHDPDPSEERRIQDNLDHLEAIIKK
jgi:hypothetical protein